MSMDTVTQDSALLYTAQPVTFVKLMIEAGRVDKLQETLAEHRYYPFLSDILLEWLERQPSPSSDVASSVVDQIVREVIGRMTTEDLCVMLDRPLSVLQQNGKLLSQDVANLLKDLRLSALADRFPLNEELTKDDVYQRVQQKEVVATPVIEAPTNYNEFLKELKDAGVLIPSANGGSGTQKQSRQKRTPVEEALAETIKPKSAKAVAAVVKEITAPKKATSVKETEAPKESSLKESLPKVASAKETFQKDTAPKEVISKETSSNQPTTQKTTRSKPEASIRSVETYFSPDAKEKVMSKIFRDDDDDYQRSIALIDRAKDWKQASIYLDALFMRRKVDPYSKTAIRLTDAVYARFHSH